MAHLRSFITRMLNMFRRSRVESDLAEQLDAHREMIKADLLSRGIDPLHTRMASFRAIEQGINLVRPTNDGLSLACDWRGNVLAVADYFETHDHSMIAQVPVKGTQTLYARLGDWLPWLCAGLLAASSLAAVRRRAGRERLSQA